MDGASAHALAQKLAQVEERLGRLLVSGWRHARAESAALRSDADDLAELGLPSVAQRVGAVADVTTAADALASIALATSA